MAKTKPTPNSTAPPKLPRLPKGTKITKRPLLHPAIASARTSSRTPKVVYVSASSPFISTVKRVRKYLSEIDARSSGRLSLLPGPGTGKDKGRNRPKVRDMGKGAEERRKEEVIVKGTGKAIEKVLRVGLYFQGQGDVVVGLRTGSVGAVDDVLNGEEREARVEEGGGGDGEGEEEVPETRVRRTSMLEVGIRLR